MRRKFTLFTLVFSLFTQLLSAQTIQDLKAPLTFFIVNDLGRNGYYQQKKIAELMILWLPICGHILQKLHSLTNQQHQPPPLWSNYIGGNKDCTTQVEYYGAKVNFGVKFNL